ncbi:alpha/beta-hydrolase [Karstenula rhodostoma CBS 690.94]|uniref:Alpha/beta-hydrolase n=1 Tax=Karstenula rhodostoma CBS 690.94 TaxID=1392251 RepID=A0A9P4PT31_9PLEO|nr:alpha/beta-hydrolase [Karstenula rhodostoma CBS 690.94]
MGFLTSHPGKAIWVLGAVLITLARLPLVSLYYIFRRPNPKWTIRQALMNDLMRAFLYHSAVVQAKTPLKLDPGSEGERFVTIPAVQSNHLKGVLDDKKIRPAVTAGTWYPSLPPEGYTGKVILHFHGGGYAIGEGRAADAAYAGKTLTDNTAPYALFVQYRLASNNGGRFPAALQDALSSYIFLLSKGYDAQDIIISGDSAGGHVALSLLRYISTEVDLSAPRALLLWSPSINLETARDPSVTNSSAYYTTDYVIGNFQSWGAKKFTEGLDLSDPNLRPYIVQSGYPFRSVSPIWVCVGGSEILGPDGIRIAEELREHGNMVETHTISGAPHDVMFVGNIMGFEKEAVEATQLAHRFIEKAA